MSIDPIEEIYRAAATELGAFLAAVTQIFGKERSGLAEDIWLEVLERYEENSGIAEKDMRCVTYLAASRMADTVSLPAPGDEERRQPLTIESLQRESYHKVREC